MGKKKKNDKSIFASQLRHSGYEGRKASEDKGKKGLKKECCEKYLKKGEHKRCRRCPCFDMTEALRLQRFKDLEIEINTED